MNIRSDVNEYHQLYIDSVVQCTDTVQFMKISFHDANTYILS